jgi:hypothetical protein
VERVRVVLAIPNRADGDELGLRSSDDDCADPVDASLSDSDIERREAPIDLGSLRLELGATPGERVAEIGASGHEAVDLPQPDSKIAQTENSPKLRKLSRGVVAIAGLGVEPDGPEQADRVV